MKKLYNYIIALDAEIVPDVSDSLQGITGFKVVQGDLSDLVEEYMSSDSLFLRLNKDKIAHFRQILDGYATLENSKKETAMGIKYDIRSTNYKNGKSKMLKGLDNLAKSMGFRFVENQGIYNLAKYP